MTTLQQYELEALAACSCQGFESYFDAHGGSSLEAAPLAASPKDAAKKNLEALRKKYGLTSSQLKTKGISAAAKLSRDAAKQYGSEFFKAVKFPGVPSNIPWTPPTDLSVASIEKSVLDTTRKYAENQIQSKIGIHLDLPTKPTLKELSKTVDSLLPDNAKEALDMALSIGTQAAASAAASALTGVLAATAIGSAIPGLGTVVGLGVGLAAVALKSTFVSVFSQSACERDKAMCKCQTPSGWKKPNPGKRSPVELLPWLAQEQAKLGRIERVPTLCTLGAVPETENWFGALSQLVIPYVGNTLPVMGLPALEKLLPAYESAAKLAPQPKGTNQGFAAGLIKYGWPGSKSSLGFETPSVASPLATIQARVAHLRKLIADANTQKDPTGLRFQLVTELNNAVEQYGLNPTSDNEKWFVTLVKAVDRLEKVEQQKGIASTKSQKEGERLQKQRYESKDGPLWKLYAARENATFQCREAGAPSTSKVQPKPCLDVKKIEAQIIERHRQGFKLPPQPKGSAIAYFEETAEKAAKQLGMKMSAPAPRQPQQQRKAEKTPTPASAGKKLLRPAKLDIKALRRTAEKTIAQAQRAAAGQPGRQAQVNAVIAQALQPSTDLITLLLSASKLPAPVVFPQGSAAATLTSFVR